MLSFPCHISISGVAPVSVLIGFVPHVFPRLRLSRAHGVCGPAWSAALCILSYVSCHYRCPQCSCLPPCQVRPAVPLSTGVLRASSLSAWSQGLDSPRGPGSPIPPWLLLNNVCVLPCRAPREVGGVPVGPAWPPGSPGIFVSVPSAGGGTRSKHLALCAACWPACSCRLCLCHLLP